MIYLFLFPSLIDYTQYNKSLSPSMLLQVALFGAFYCWVIFHIFFIHSSVNGHLGYFHDLAIVNSAAMNIGVHVSFGIIIFSGLDFTYMRYPE